MMDLLRESDPPIEEFARVTKGELGKSTVRYRRTYSIVPRTVLNSRSSSVHVRVLYGTVPGTVHSNRRGGVKQSNRGATLTSSSWVTLLLRQD